MSASTRNIFGLTALSFVSALLGCATQDETHVQVESPDVAIDRLAATIPIHPLVRPPLSEDLRQIQASMITVLETTPDVENAKLGNIAADR